MKVIRYTLIFAVIFLYNCDQKTLPPDRFDSLFSGDLEVIDLTYGLNNKSPFWPGPETSPFEYDTLAAHESGSPSMGAYNTPEHFSTHIDAPIHFSDKKKSVDQLTSADLFGPAAVINVEGKCNNDPDYLLSIEDLQKWEDENGMLPQGAIVLMLTGWGTKWNDVDAFRNQDDEGKMHFPGFSEELAKVLIEERNIRGIGIDNFSVDAATSQGFPVHHVVNGAGKYHLENVANLENVPASGAYLIVAPIKLEGGSGGQVRIFAVVP